MSWERRGTAGEALRAHRARHNAAQAMKQSGFGARCHADALQPAIGGAMPSTHTLEKKDAIMGCGGGAAAGDAGGTAGALTGGVRGNSDDIAEARRRE